MHLDQYTLLLYLHQKLNCCLNTIYLLHKQEYSFKVINKAGLKNKLALFFYETFATYYLAANFPCQQQATLI
jgi:ABC-type thiamin/hydroxymethylpyrimidine transport system permease subunit